MRNATKISNPTSEVGTILYCLSPEPLGGSGGPECDCGGAGGAGGTLPPFLMMSGYCLGFVSSLLCAISTRLPSDAPSTGERGLELTCSLDTLRRNRVDSMVKVVGSRVRRR